jgi:hypothetical protein
MEHKKDNYRTCPKCKAKHPLKTEYCVCGQKLPSVADMLKDLLGANIAFGDMFGGKSGT